MARNYKAEYAARIARGQSRGLTPGQAIGHPEKGRQTITQLVQAGRIAPIRGPSKLSQAYTAAKQKIQQAEASRKEEKYKLRPAHVVFVDPSGLSLERIQKLAPKDHAVFIRITLAGDPPKIFQTRLVNPKDKDGLKLARDDVKDWKKRYRKSISKIEYVYVPMTGKAKK